MFAAFDGPVDIDPNFAQNGYFYLYWLPRQEKFRVSRFTHVENEGGTSSRAEYSSEVVLWKDTDDAPSCCHYGGGMGVGPDGKLYFCTGDKFEGGDISQNISRGGGKVHRINLDGTVPVDNLGMQDGPGGEMLDSVFATGMRNPYKATWDFPTSRFLIADVGGNNQKTAWEEVNVLKAKRNYGWPLCEGPCSGPSRDQDFPQCSCSKHANPLYAYPHGKTFGGKGGASITGGVVYRGKMFPPQYVGKYFYGDYVKREIFSVTLPEGDGAATQHQLPFEWPDAFSGKAHSSGPPSAFAVAPDGALWYANTFGTIRRISYEVDAPTVSLVVPSVRTCNGVPCTVSFFSTVKIEKGCTADITWYFGDGATSTVVKSNAATTTRHKYDSKGEHTAYFVITDSKGRTGRSGDIVIVVGAPPMANILSPKRGSRFHAGEILRFVAAQTNAKLTHTWNLKVKHNEHFHPLVSDFMQDEFDHVVETEGHTFADKVFYVAELESKDEYGLASTTSIELYPELVFVTVTTDPPGLNVYIDGIPYTTPHVLQSMVLYHHTVRVDEEHISTAGIYAFSRWSDNGATSHVVTMPAVNGTSIVARYFSIADKAPLYRINCGGPTIVDPDGRMWLNDEAFTADGKEYGQLKTGFPSNSPLSTERVAKKKESELRYRIPVPKAGKYVLLLQFVESYFDGCANSNGACPGKRVSAIWINGERVIEKYDISENAAPKKPHTYMLFATVTDSSELTLEIRKGNDRPLINAITVVRRNEIPTTTTLTTLTTLTTVTTVTTKTTTTRTTTTVTTKTTTPVPITTRATTATTAKMNVATTPVPTTTRATVAHAMQTNVEASMVSFKTCTELGWAFKLANTHVCGASKINGKCHKGTAILAKASKVCKNAGGRLCSVQELAAGAAHATGCGMDNAWVWTNTECEGGAMIALGKHQPEQPARCSKIDMNGKHSVRCCADRHSDVVTVPVVIKKTPPPVASVVSAAACATLGWAFKLDNTRVCGASKINGKCHKGTAILAKASKVCKNAGGRLCSVQELAAGAAHATGCGMDNAWVWTNTECEGGAMIALGKHQPEQPARCSKIDMNGKHSVRCCADRHSDVVTVPVVIKKTPPPVASVVSAAACATLGWAFKLDNTRVCGASKINGKCHKESASLAKASNVCGAVGARLCSVQEITAGAAHDTGCGMDKSWVWTSTECEGGAMVASGKHQTPQCVPFGSMHSVRCCADTSAAAPSRRFFRVRGRHA